jgi:hypothetical protein
MALSSPLREYDKVILLPDTFSIALIVERYPYRSCSVRLVLVLLEWADAQTGRADLSWSLSGMHSFLFACYWKVFVGETPTLALCRVRAVRDGSRTTVRNALTRASPTREHDR